MNLTVDRDHLKAALARTKPAVGRNGLPVLTGVRIDPDNASLTTTNLDLAITTELDTDGVGDPIVVPHERLAALVGSCPDGPVVLEADADQLTVTAGRVVAHLRLLPADEWPKLPIVEGDPIKLGEVWDAVLSVKHAKSTDVSRPSITPVEIAGGSVTATDGYRLASTTVDTDLDVVLPGHLIDAVGGATDVQYAASGRWVWLRSDLTSWSAILSEAAYATWRGLIPEDPPVRFTVDRAALIEALGAIGSIGIDAAISATVVVVKLTVDGGQILVEGASADAGVVVVPLEASDVEADDGFVVRFNTTYLVNMLRHLQGDAVTLTGADNLKPWIATEGDHLELLMPFRVTNR